MTKTTRKNKINKTAKTSAKKTMNKKTAERRGKPSKAITQEVQQLSQEILETMSVDNLENANGIFFKPESHKKKYGAYEKQRSKIIMLKLTYDEKRNFKQYCFERNMSYETGFLSIVGKRYNSEMLMEIEWSFNRKCQDLLKKAGTLGKSEDPEEDPKYSIKLDFSGRIFAKAFKLMMLIAHGAHNRILGSWAIQVVSEAMSKYKRSQILSSEEVENDYNACKEFAGFDPAKHEFKARKSEDVTETRIVATKTNTKKLAAVATKLGRNLAKRQDQITKSKQGWVLKPSYILTANDMLRIAMMQNGLEQQAVAARK